MKDDRAYLQHILAAIERLEQYTAPGYDAFLEDELRQDGVIRQLEIMGEATKRLSPSIRSKHPDIPWRRIAGLRDVLIHQYMGIDLNVTWEAATSDAQKLKQAILDLHHET